MKTFSFHKNVSKQMTSYESSSVSYSHIVQIAHSTSIACMHIEPNGVVGIHKATCPQLFLVVQGEGGLVAKLKMKGRFP